MYWLRANGKLQMTRAILYTEQTLRSKTTHIPVQSLRTVFRGITRNPTWCLPTVPTPKSPETVVSPLRIASRRTAVQKRSFLVPRRQWTNTEETSWRKIGSSIKRIRKLWNLECMSRICQTNSMVKLFHCHKRRGLLSCKSLTTWSIWYTKSLKGARWACSKENPKGLSNSRIPFINLGLKIIWPKQSKRGSTKWRTYWA